MAKCTEDECIAATEAIITSPAITGYLIGYTSDSLANRLYRYKGESFKHLVILADKLNRKDALDLERSLQLKATKAKKSHILYRKYHPDKRDKPLIRSKGTGKIDADALVHSVYLAWW